MEYLTIKDYFNLIEFEKVLPAMPAVIPGIGEIPNLYEFALNNISEFLNNKSVTHFEQLNIIFRYLIEIGLLKSTKHPEPANIPDVQHYVEPQQPDSNIMLAEIPEQPQPITLWDLNFNFGNIPETQIRLSPAELITNPAKFIDSHLSICQRNNGNKTYLPYYDRLIKLNHLLNN